MYDIYDRGYGGKILNESIASRIERIQAGKVTKSQRKLLEYFDSVDYQKIIYMSITELAEDTGVAEATVLRFCRSLGFNGYQEFKLHLAQDVTAGTKTTEDVEYLSDILDGYQTALDKSRKCITPQILEETVRLMLSARTISCCGVGHSYLAALELHNRLLKMGMMSSCEKDMHFQNILISSRDERDVLVIFSVSGGTKDIIEVAELARSCGMKIIVITCHDRSPLTRFADVVISATPMESPEQAGSMASKIMQLFIADVICHAIHLSDKVRFDSYIAKGNVATAKKLV